MPTSWRMHPTDISTADTTVTRKKPKKKPELKPKPGRSAEKENGMAAPAARKDPIAPIRNSERLGAPRGRGRRHPPSWDHRWKGVPSVRRIRHPPRGLHHSGVAKARTLTVGNGSGIDDPEE